MLEFPEKLSAAPLASQRLVLEPLRLEHADELPQILDDVSLHRFTGGTPPTSKELRARIERQVRGQSPDEKNIWLNWVVRERSTRRIVGTMQATVPAGRDSCVALLAWVIGSAYQGRGLATEAAQLMASWLREQGISCLRANIHPRHDASMAVAAAIGLKPTNVMISGERRWESSPPG